MRERFITLAPRGDQRRITSRDRLAWCFSRPCLKRAAPQHRLGIVQISFDQELLFFRGRTAAPDRKISERSQAGVVARRVSSKGGRNTTRDGRAMLSGADRRAAPEL